MKITVNEERVFPTIGLIANAGDTVDVPHEDDETSKPEKAVTKKVGDI